MRPTVWQPPVETTADEDKIIKHIKRAKLFLFLRRHRSNSKFGFYPVLAGSISSCSAIKAIKWDQLSKKRYLVRVVKS